MRSAKSCRCYVHMCGEKRAVAVRYTWWISEKRLVCINTCVDQRKMLVCVNTGAEQRKAGAVYVHICAATRAVAVNCHMRGSVPAVPVYVHACGATQLMFGSCTCMCSVNTGCVCTRVRAAQVVDVDVHMCGAKRAVAVQVHMVDQRMCGPAQAVPVTEVSCSCVTTQARLVQACMVVRVRSGIGVLANTLHISLVHAPAVPVHGHVCGAAQLGDVCVQWCVTRVVQPS